ncbi:MAG: tryptophan synthase subunit alpha [Candidatus Omnitrophota bacterium]|nr:MAG: tryptophan synthase subunit alpha [Candidatus Omnitrophota bacterium]
MNRIDKKFKALKKAKKKAFIIFITAGFPDLKTTEKLILSLGDSAADILELGVPFSDPLADGPIIQESSQAALKKGTNLNRILNLVKKVRKHTQVPICLMTYYNPIYCFGEEKFIKAASQAGVDGVIIPDLPPEEAGEFIKTANKSGLHNICFLSPTSAKERVGYISNKAKGFIYYVSLTGVTGPRKALPKDLISHLKSIRRKIKKPLCVGFGISAPAQVRQIQKVADGAIVGSAIVKQIKNNIGKPDLVKKVTLFAEKLARA